MGVRSALTGLGLVALSLAPLSAQTRAEGPEGRWLARWAQAVRTLPGDSVEIQRWGNGELVLEVDGEVVTGVWTTDVAGRVNWMLDGTYRDGVLLLHATHNDATRTELDVVERLEIRGTADGDSLEGSILLETRGRKRGPVPRPLTARRSR